MKKKLTIGILAHVDAGKTTLSEALLYTCGKIRTLGRVDHKNTYLDTNEMERMRGITIFSKQARFESEMCDFVLLDTPGHVDFSAETERTLSLLDYAILVVSAPDGVQNHTRTLWNLLEFYRVPTFIFVNKTDISTKYKAELEAELSKALSPSCVAMYNTYAKHELDERLALVSEDFLDSFLAGKEIPDEEIAMLVSARRLFPVLFGSALKNEGVDFLISALDKYTIAPQYSEAFGAKVYKISHLGNTRLTYMKVTGGKLSARDEIKYLSSTDKLFSEKISEIRLYSGEKFTRTENVTAGEVCAVAGLSATYAGQGLGEEENNTPPILEPVLSYKIILPEGSDPTYYFPLFKALEEEEPSLHLYWNEELRQIEARLMGDIQIDLVKKMILDRFSIDVEMGQGKILYKEKIKNTTVGVGHYEPLRHYSEVHLLLEPQPEGTGLTFDVRLSENTLDINWQRLILSNLQEKNHRGTLCGAPLTDTKITLVAGKAHLKHTEGGDFFEASARAVRQGLMKAGCVLLEPFYKYRLEVPTDSTGRALSDLQSKFCTSQIEQTNESTAVICGRGPVSCLCDYPRQVISYTHGKGNVSLIYDGYEPCHNEAEIVEGMGYNPEADLENPPHSVFCAHGAGFHVPWQEVDSYKHLDVEISPLQNAEAIIPKASGIARKYQLSEEELKAIMAKTFGPEKPRYTPAPKVFFVPKKDTHKRKPLLPTKRHVIVDGYNVIYSWENLRNMAKSGLDEARESLLDILSNYVAFTKTELTAVFDAYRVAGGQGGEYTRDGFRVVFTKADETADAYIEKMMTKLGPDYNIKVVTGDRLVQISAVSAGVSRMTAEEFRQEITRVGNEITDFIKKYKGTQK